MTDLGHRFTADSVGRALDLVGERWSLLILREAFFGVRRYGEFARTLSIPRPTLSARLKTLVDAGVLDRVDPVPEYRLTPAGRDLFGAVVTLMQWGDRHLAGPEGPPILLRHNDCGEIAETFVACGHCGGAIATDRVTPEPGPGFR
ncbi:helix-turn-helix domain-containing protein [Amycolatopsis sp. SID8362]|uniref:winged helix-turn-helix transcriptional regulator n=1 Tax=unclassified Amycolatopsis TaxID=2618356 RepID=UPI001369494E|nr:helix-turn-helix domain-containing protein [Amycolatopsis sp. SID8362]NBH08929.1 transcriptional regulator [Amycolatopsis sp. SID8362]NED45621.1 helix-turn-helix transcriptional regulator [Amycolatopsis sp. SID8362]